MRTTVPTCTDGGISSLTSAEFAELGKGVGQPIPGSKYMTARCYSCGTVVRAKTPIAVCEGCTPGGSHSDDEKSARYFASMPLGHQIKARQMLADC